MASWRVKRKRAPVERRPAFEKEFTENGEQGAQPEGVQIAGHANPTVPLLRKEPPPSAKTSRRGGASWAQAQEQVKNKSKIHGAMIRIIRIPILFSLDAPFIEHHHCCDVGCRHARLSSTHVRYYDAEAAAGVIHMSQYKLFLACNFSGESYVYMSNSTLMTTWGSR